MAVSRRIAMSREELEAFLEEQKTVILTTINRDGTSLPSPLWFVAVDGRLYMNTGAQSDKVRNLRRDDRVSCLVEAGESYYDLRGALIRGRCTIVVDEQEQARARAKIAEKYAAARPQTGLRPSTTVAAERVTLKVPIERVVSWDYAKLRG